MNRYKDKEIKENWFYEHVADLKYYGDIKTLRWGKPNHWMYRCNYVFQGRNMYVSGDIGEAVFCFTELADVNKIADYSLSYFESKLRAFCEPEKEFDSEKAIKRLRAWLKELKECGTEWDHDEMRRFFEEVKKECTSKKNFEFIINNHYDMISELDQDFWEWLPGCGDETPMRIRAYLIGLKMAAEQLKGKVII